jgi:lipopolysaccharide cholinephosphotransferase
MREITLEEQKQLMLEMLKEYDSFCKKHHLSYFLTGGTLLGAVRHHGYIPWDDDIDVGMPRKDYETFVTLFNEANTNPNYRFVSFHQEPDLYVSSGKLMDTRTVMEEAVDTDTKIGVYLDVFPLDNLGDTEAEARQFTEACLKLRRQLDVQNWKIIPERKWYLNLVIRIIKAFSPKGTCRDLVQKQDAFCQTYAGEKLTAYVGYPCAAMKQELLKGEWFSEYEVVPFEQYAFRIPKGYKDCLTVFYGPSYMELPPLEKQKTHHAYQVWFKD